MKKMQRQVPLAEVELNELAAGEQVDRLYREQLDIGFVHAKLSRDVLNTRIVARDRLIVAVPSSCKLANCRRVDLKDLASWPAIMPAGHSSSGFYEQVRMAYQRAGVRPERVHNTRLLQTGLLLVAAGLGVSLVPESFQSMHVKEAAGRASSLRDGGRLAPGQQLSASEAFYKKPAGIKLIFHRILLIFFHYHRILFLILDADWSSGL